MKDKMMCKNCKAHKANIDAPWLGDEGMMAYVHGMYTYWCDCCMVKAQIIHAEDAVKRLKELKIKLKGLKCI